MSLSWLLTVVACRGPQDGGNEPVGDGVLLVHSTEVVFDALDIGTDPPASQEVRVANAGSGPLSVAAPRIEGDGAFTAHGMAIVLEPSHATVFDVQFDPEAPFSHEAVLVIDSDAAAQPIAEVAVRGEAIAPVIEVDESTLDVGVTEVGCIANGTVVVHNTGNEVLEVAPSIVGSTELALVDEPESVEIYPGDEASIDVSYAPVDGVADTAILALDSTDPIRPHTEVEVSGAGAMPATQSDWFEGVAPVTDVVFVVDDSGSMGEEYLALIDTIGTFVDSIAATVDYRIGVITIETSKFEDDVITNGTADGAGALTEQVTNIGLGGAIEGRAFEMLYDCLQPGSDCSEDAGFLRADAMLDVIVVSDGIEESELAPKEYVDYLWTLKSDPRLVRVNALAGSVPKPTCFTCYTSGLGYDDGVALTEGMFLDICGDWTDNVTSLGAQAISTVSWRFPLTETPDVGTIEVFVDGKVVDDGAWAYVGWAGDWVNVIEFDLGALPPGGAEIEVRYAVLADCP